MRSTSLTGLISSVVKEARAAHQNKVDLSIPVSPVGLLKALISFNKITELGYICILLEYELILELQENAPTRHRDKCNDVDFPMECESCIKSFRRLHVGRQGITPTRRW